MKPSLQDPVFLGVVVAVGALIALLLIALAVYLILKSQKKDETADDKEAPPEQPGRVLTLAGLKERETYRETMRRLKEKLPGWSSRYKIPWFVMVGEPGTGKSTIANSVSGLSADVVDVAGAHYTPRWLLLDQAVLIDMPGEAFQTTEPADATEPADQEAEVLTRAAWRRFLNQIKYYRPRQPLNGIVLTISAEELLAAQADPDHQLRMNRIRSMVQRMDEVQQLTGLSLPVYVLVTKCDSIRGFGGYARAIMASSAAKNRALNTESWGEITDDLFGWSNPYSVQSEYTPEWIDEAFASTAETLLRHQLEMMALCEPASEADKVFLFPFELQKLKAPLQVALNLIFRSTAYRSSHLLRGVYFCGRAQDAGEKASPENVPLLEATAASGGLIIGDPNRVVFARNLFQFKVFVERYLAAPAAGRFFANRSVLAARITGVILALFLTAATLHAWKRIDSLQKNTIEPLLAYLTHNLDSMAISPETEIAPAVDMLNSIGSARENEYYSLAMPYSYLDIEGLHRDLHQALERIFEVVVLRSCKEGLESRIKSIIQRGVGITTSPAGFASNSTGNGWAGDPAYRELQRYEADLKELNINIDRYNLISGAGSGSFAQLNALLQYLGGRSLPDSSRLSKDPQYRRILLDVTWQSLRMPPKYDQATAGIARQLISNFYRSWFDLNPLILEVNELSGSGGVQMLMVPGAVPSNEQLRALVSRVHAVDNQINAGAYDWVAEDFHRENYPALGARLSEMPFADIQFTEAVTMEGAAKLAGMRLAMQTSPPVLDLEEGKVRLNGQVRALTSVLDALLAYDLMNQDTGNLATGNCRLIPAGTIWSQSDLSKAAQAGAARNKIEAELLPSLPGVYRERVRNIVDDRATNAIFLQLLEAAIPAQRQVSKDALLDAAIKNFDASIEQLGNIEEILTGLHATAEASCLNRSLVRQANSLLGNINQQLPALYAPNAAANLSNGAPLSQALYGVASDDDLAAYLSAEREKITTLAADAGPLVQFLQSQGVHSEVLTRWYKISQDVAAFQAKKPGNPIQALENYIASDIDKTTPEAGCNASGVRFSTDGFLAVRGQLAEIAVDHCRRVAADRFNEIANNFNRRLAGRFPFSSAMDTRSSAEALPAEIAAFYQIFDRNSTGLARVLNGPAENSQDVLGFLKAIEAVRPLVAGGPDPGAPALGVAVAFRTNQIHEVYADRIAEWRLQIGQHVTDSFPGQDEVLPLLWQPGDPVILSIRYANNSRELPAPPIPSFNATVNDRTVIYTYSDTWSLFSLLGDHRPGEIDAQNQYAAHIPNRPATGVRTAATPDTVAFFSVDLLPAGAKPGTPTIAVPAFPKGAPLVRLKPPHGD